MAKEIGDGTTTATILAHAMVRGGVKAVAAELLEDTPGALWSHGSIEASRLRSAPQMTRVVVAIDPAVTSGEEADETGIVVTGKDQNGHGYVLADISGRYPPTAWARLGIAADRTHRADRIVAEVNNGGDMVGATLRMVDPNVAFTAVRASRGKIVRAEPVAALYDQGRVHHIGTFPQLEEHKRRARCSMRRPSGCGIARHRCIGRLATMTWSLSTRCSMPEPISSMPARRSMAAPRCHLPSATGNGRRRGGSLNVVPSPCFGSAP